MSEIRGERICFRKEDIVALHALPSAQAHDPVIVHAPSSGGTLRLCGKVFLCFSLVFFLIMASLIAVVESGLADGPLNARARKALNGALGPSYSAEVESTVLRVTARGALALKARGVTLNEGGAGRPVVRLAAVSIALDPLALLMGRIAVSRLEADGGDLDTGLLPRGEPVNLAAIRIADVGTALEALFTQVDGMSRLTATSATQTIQLSDFSLSVTGARARSVPIHVESLAFSREPDGSIRVDGAVAMDGRRTHLAARAFGDGGRITAIEAALEDVPLTPFLYHGKSGNEDAFGIDTAAGVSLKATRAADGTKPTLAVAVRTSEGRFHAGGLTSALNPSELNISYDFERSSVEILPSMVRIGQSTFPFTGALVDLDKVSDAGKRGFAVDLLLRDASSAPEDMQERPLTFDAKANGRFEADTNRLIFDRLMISSPLGSMAGSLSAAFGKTSPQISFVALSDQMHSTAIKQLWPWWIAKGARRWAIGNLFGGMITDARIEVSIPEGRIAESGGDLRLDEHELNINFAIDDTRINIAGEIPPLRDTSGSFRLSGERMSVAVGKGVAYFASGRSVTLNGGEFVIPDVHMKPLMAEMKIEVGGQADAIAELVAYRPIHALQKTPFVPEDFKGPMTALVGARFGLIMDQDPPRPLWQAEMRLQDVTLNRPVAGRTIENLTGAMRIDNSKAVLDADALIDGAKMRIALTEPVDPAANVTRTRDISGTLDDAARRKIAPALSGIVGGPAKVEVSLAEDGSQSVKADLAGASLSLPWIGWSKGAGIAAKAEFTVKATDGITEISDFRIAGDGFGATGDLRVDDAGLATARLNGVRLAHGDDFSVAVERGKGGYTVALTGPSADIRLPLARAKGGASSGDAGNVKINARLDRVTGFNGEVFFNVNFAYSTRGQQIDDVDLSAVTGSGQAVVARMVKAGADNTLELTTSDAGALARFTDIYRNMRGGLLNLRLRDRGARSWRGAVDLRKFSLIGEQKLKSMVSTPAGQDGRSLNQAVRRDIDVSTARFERGYAQLLLDRGVIRVDGGVLRGVDVGATFQGTIRDANGRMDMTGTFMPAYGLNRLFGELPLIGALLGNGRDRGLLGITFKLTGPFDQPSLLINPLSIIAPGVFRNIFEFQ
ncbi:Large exoproteins involved in heme utilization or adhesion [Sinorhizobium sojae CCBAU 05684]|uniref:Large exoproteins involved in heme utilization or adhesion n=1 Tax=Sinorhizobium sojae CCBAU 05684 TaxID=716928 RepID=A0A249PBA8_9HYPH|nr:AsmA-like C-terminal region-containing protein [Sinorhizobium sojae]ASY63055.1 Large exoproteins involved in heme utilization or adhesion [Sinorhizobium sojae CCBAU 05684]